MMFTKAFALLALPFLASATPLVERGNTAACNTGNVQCCNEVAAPGSSTYTEAGLIGLLTGVASGNSLALGCVPITVIGASGNSCSQQTVCCNGNNNSNNLINASCSPLTIGL